MVFDYPEDKWTRRIEDQLIVGESIIIAPVLEEKGTDSLSTKADESGEVN